MKFNFPLVSFDVAAPNFLQVFVKSRNWLVYVELAEMLFSEFYKVDFSSQLTTEDTVS